MKNIRLGAGMVGTAFAKHMQSPGSIPPEREVTYWTRGGREWEVLERTGGRGSSGKTGLDKHGERGLTQPGLSLRRQP